MVIWSVDVTIVEDTDWERMGSLSDVLSSAGRFIGVDFSLFPDLIVPSIETFMISILGTFCWCYYMHSCHMVWSEKHYSIQTFDVSSWQTINDP